MINLPNMLRVRQRLVDRRLTDVRGAVLSELSNAPFLARVTPGSRIAIGAGSRGVANIAEIVRATADFFTTRGASPFVFPAMGSHGGATAEGQRDVLARYGITEATMGCPVIAAMDVVATGPTPSGIASFIDKAAFASDGIFLINRVKWHTSFEGPVESGVVKMAAIGLGKIDGAKSCHAHARSLGMGTVIQEVARQNVATGKLLGGLGVLEDARHNTARVAALDSATLIEGEAALFAQVKSWMARIPVPLDILIVDEIGKDISGTGMDTKVVNRGVQGQYNPWPYAQRIQRIFLRDLSPASHGNAVGVGMADVIHDRLLAKIDSGITWVNTVTSGSLAAARIPIHYSTDRRCIEMLTQTVGKADASQVTIGRIRNSLELENLELSENCRGLIAADPSLDVLGEPFPMTFDAAGDLDY